VTPSRQTPLSPTSLPAPSLHQSPTSVSPPKVRVTPTLTLTSPISPTPRGVSQLQEEPQGRTLAGESLASLKKADVRGPLPLLTVTATSPAKETAPYRLHGEAKSCANKPGKANVCDPRERQKEAPRLAPDTESPAAVSRGQDGRLQRTSAWQFWFQRCNQDSRK
jgi:hypothetical protein